MQIVVLIILVSKLLETLNFSRNIFTCPHNFVPNYILRTHVKFLIWQETNWKLAGEDEIVGDDQEGTWACVKQQCWEPSAAQAAPSILCSTWQMAGLKFSCLAEKLEV